VGLVFFFLVVWVWVVAPPPVQQFRESILPGLAYKSGFNSLCGLLFVGFVFGSGCVVWWFVGVRAVIGEGRRDFLSRWPHRFEHDRASLFGSVVWSLCSALV